MSVTAVAASGRGLPKRTEQQEDALNSGTSALAAMSFVLDRLEDLTEDDLTKAVDILRMAWRDIRKAFAVLDGVDAA
jgi:hypothetical protein